MHAFADWILTATGANNLSGWQYGLWSGVLGDLTMFGVLGIIWHRLNCHAKGCYRIGLHHVGTTGYVTCRKHHPTLYKKVSAETIHRKATK